MESQQPDTTEITKESGLILADANCLVVTSAEEYAAVGDFLTRIPPVLKQIEEVLGPFRDDAHKMHKRFCARINELKAPLEQAKQIGNGKLLVYRREEQARAAAEQARLQAEARKREEEARLAEAAELEAKGKTEEAEAVIDRPATPYVPVVKPDIPKVPGISARKLPWNWRLRDEAKVPREYLMLDKMKINKVVRAMGAQANIPGIEPYQDETMAIGAGR